MRVVGLPDNLREKLNISVFGGRQMRPGVVHSVDVAREGADALDGLAIESGDEHGEVQGYEGVVPCPERRGGR